MALEPAGVLRSCEGTLKDLLLKMGVTEANHISGSDSFRRSQKLLKMAMTALRKLDDSLPPAPPEPNGKGIVSPSQEAAMSLSGPPLTDGQEVACAALCRRMGIRE